MNRSNDFRDFFHIQGCDRCEAIGQECDLTTPRCGHCSCYNLNCERTSGTGPTRLSERPTSEMSQSSNTNDRGFYTFQKRLAVIGSRIPRQFQESQGSQMRKLPLKLGVEELLVDFLRGFIKSMPLYTEKVGWDMINAWQCDLNEPDDCTWGAINVLLALALRHRPGGAEGREKLALECIENARSVSHTFVRDLDFKGLRATLGLAILLMNTDEPARASVPVGIAVSLCRQMNLHLNHEDNPRFWERKQLFRITYILDRDLAFRTKQPYLLQDEDIEISISESHLCDLLGTSEVALPLHIFNLRIQLAEIQSLAYELISPQRGRTMSPLIRQRDLEELDRQLRDLFLEIPHSLRPFHTRELEPALRRPYIELHSGYFHVLFASRGASIRNKVWVQRLKDYYVENGGNLYQDDERTELSDADRCNPLFPYNWTMLVKSARCCAPLFNAIPDSDEALIWRCMPALEASLVILCADNFTVMDKSKMNIISENNHHITEILCKLNNWLAVTSSDVLRETHRLCLIMGILAFDHGAQLVQESAMPIKQEPCDQ